MQSLMDWQDSVYVKWKAKRSVLSLFPLEPTPMHHDIFIAIHLEIVTAKPHRKFFSLNRSVRLWIFQLNSFLFQPLRLAFLLLLTFMLSYFCASLFLYVIFHFKKSNVNLHLSSCFWRFTYLVFPNYMHGNS